jgi:hypothetical protein
MATKKSSGKSSAVVLGAVLGIASLSSAHGHHGHGIIASLTSTGGANLSTRVSWARAFLKADHLPRTRCNLNAVTAWELREGGGFGNQAAGNPLNVNPPPGTPWPGYHAIGAWAFPDAATGLRYTVATLNNGYYPGILAALRRGNNAQRVCDAIMASPWAASHYGGTLSASC